MFLVKFEISMLDFPVYSSDLAPCNVFSFPKVKLLLKGTRLMGLYAGWFMSLRQDINFSDITSRLTGKDMLDMWQWFDHHSGEEEVNALAATTISSTAKSDERWFFYWILINYFTADRLVIRFVYTLSPRLLRQHWSCPGGTRGVATGDDRNWCSFCCNFGKL